MSLNAAALPELRLAIVPPDVESPLAVATLLADCSRARILALLRDGPHCVCELAAALGERSNNVSNHLARLREAGLVATSQISRDTRRVYYERDEIACAAALAQLRILLEPA
jgi:ArsR family transcriptional regulator